MGERDNVLMHAHPSDDDDDEYKEGRDMTLPPLLSFSSLTVAEDYHCLAISDFPSMLLLCSLSLSLALLQVI